MGTLNLVFQTANLLTRTLNQTTQAVPPLTGAIGMPTQAVILMSQAVGSRKRFFQKGKPEAFIPTAIPTGEAEGF
jgi:hypothetical protein